MATQLSDEYVGSSPTGGTMQLLISDLEIYREFSVLTNLKITKSRNPKIAF